MSKQAFVNEGNPEHVKPGDIFSVSGTWTGASSVTTPTSTVWVDGSEDPDTILSGSNSSSGTTQTSKTLTIPSTYGSKQIINQLTAVVDGSTFSQWLDYRVSELPR